MTPEIHVGIDARCLNTGHVRGMGKYVSEMVAHVEPGQNVRFTLFGDRPETALHRPSGYQGQVELFDVKGYRFHTWEQLGLPLRSRLARNQVLHCTATTLPYWQPVPTVVTVHDTLPWQEPATGAYERWYMDRLIPAALRRCRGIITISEASRADILKLWPRLESKLHVIPHGVSDAYLEAREEPQAAGLQDLANGAAYLLYVGGALERKRFPWATRLLEQLPDERVMLIACGFDAAERAAALERLPPALRARIVFPGFVAEDRMIRLYQHAVAVLYPTLYEGFGLPALEAQAVGTPVLFAALGSLRELCGPAAEILPADDMEAWLQTTQRLLAQRGRGATPLAAARKWARRFSWSVSAARHLEVYRAAGRNVGVQTT